MNWILTYEKFCEKGRQTNASAPISRNAAQAVFAETSSLKIPNTEGPLPLILEISAPCFVISLRKADTSDCN